MNNAFGSMYTKAAFRNHPNTDVRERQPNIFIPSLFRQSNVNSIVIDVKIVPLVYFYRDMVIILGDMFELDEQDEFNSGFI